ncbi:MAG: Inosine-uridine preferring nucleoside hydrolase [Candidatus Carbobacillus altaicus]|uniref:Inosine-uridine preferring nucleoside hydrolase n=1 Tax=Candidatus Carbonibacillus altaicus TaxID=2163959 RepID=A0A2R6Y2J0_9BACL|nr:MAG: Inosine-uridine preferring nucleoside hydrolase [Candidatus Carbobacillus altaicus]
MTMNKIIIDTDVGSDVDDAMALSLAMRSPEIQIVGITTVYGDVTIRSRVAKKLLHLGGCTSVPVYPGIRDPLLRNREIFWAGHESMLLQDEEELNIEDKHGVDFIIETIMNHPGEITLVTIGPLTNIAAAIIREPKIVQNVKEIILMGGVCRLGSNGADLPVTEHNVRSDPESASLVFRSGAPIVMVGLDVTLKVKISAEVQKKLKTSGDPLNMALADALGRWLDFRQRDWTAMHDPVAVSLLIDRSLVTTRKMNVWVEYDHRHPTGQTVAVPADDGNVEVCLDVDSPRFLSLFTQRLLDR